jgi:hypothetical protein
VREIFQQEDTSTDFDFGIGLTSHGFAGDLAVTFSGSISKEKIA